ncbi:MAG: cation transporter [Spirochaetes bacterium GWB1_59_5]|nr:MAG: cation transporter [Spirochaetes bacterium GWB1_59_5]
MRNKPKAEDYRIIASYAGRVAIGLGFACAVPLLAAVVEGEWAVCVDFVICATACFLSGAALAMLMPDDARPGWLHGMVATAVAWLFVMALAAIPYRLSGHYGSYLDCMFDAMSGFTTTGLTLVGDLDHLSAGLNTWRHVITFIGGQGVVVLALSFLIGGSAGSYELYVGEAKDERLFPSVMHTAKTIWKISAVYFAVGIAALWATGVAIGLPIKAAFYHGAWIYMAAWSTGGFAPMSQNFLYYHSAAYDAVGVAFFVAGSLNFALHHAVLTGNRREMLKNVETISFFVTFTGLFSVIAAGLTRAGVYPDFVALMRKGFYHAISAHTTTGFMTVAARQFALEWGDLALCGMILAMMIGGSACSTAGGVKGLRVGGIWLAARHETRRLLLPAGALFPRKLHMVEDRFLGDEQVKGFALVTVLYVGMWAMATLAGVAVGYPILDAAFEAASVSGNVGLSIGVTSSAMPNFLKIAYILVMWAGRLEFMAVLALGGFVVSAVRRRR